MNILGIDPGNHVGIAKIQLIDGDIRIDELPYFTDNRETFYDTLEQLVSWADIVVVEDFKIFPKKAMRGELNFDSVPASIVIGAIERECRRQQTEIRKQLSAVKPVGYGYLNMKYEKNKKNVHHWDALAHAVYYVVKVHKVLPPSAGKRTP